MATHIISTTLQLLNGTAANWASENRVLPKGMPGYELDTGLLKIGDGVTAWNSLKYVAAKNDSSGNIISATYLPKTVALSGYYTKTEVDSAISTAISSITDGDNTSY